jgi:hypothetical protein
MLAEQKGLLLGVILAVAGLVGSNVVFGAGRGGHCDASFGRLGQCFLGHVVQGALGVAIAGALLLYLLTADVKAVFAR